MKDIKTFVLFCKNKGLDAKDTKTLDLFMNNSVYQNTRSGDFVLEDELQLQWSDKYGCYIDLEAREELYEEIELVEKVYQCDLPLVRNYIVSEGYFKKVNNDVVFKGKKFRYFKTFDQAFAHYTNLKMCFDNGRYYHHPKDNHFTGITMVRQTVKGFKVLDDVLLLMDMEDK